MEDNSTDLSPPLFCRTSIGPVVQMRNFPFNRSRKSLLQNWRKPPNRTPENEQAYVHISITIPFLNISYQHISSDKAIELEARVLEIEKILFTYHDRGATNGYHTLNTHTYGVQRKASYPSISSDVIMEWTSATYRQQGIIFPYLNQVFFKNSSPSHYPKTVLRLNSIPPKCWYFTGNHGYIGIKLIASSQLSHISLISDFSEPYGVRRFALWAEVHENLTQIEASVKDNDFPSAAPSMKFMLLGEFNTTSTQSHLPQIYPIEIARMNGWKFDRLLVKVVDNFGSTEKTCLRRIWLHGSGISE